MKKIFSISSLLPIAYCLLSIAISSCKKENLCDCIKGTGDIIKEQRSVSDFTSIEVNRNIYVVLTQDTINSVEVEAGENLLPLIRTHVRDGLLIINNDNTCNWVRDYSKKITAYVHVKDLREIRSYSTKNIISTNVITSSKIDILNFFSGDITVIISAAESYTKQMGSGGDITVSGHSGFNYIFSQGYGYLHLENLDSESALVWQKGTGDIHLSVRNSMDVQIDYVGNVYYSGNPVIDQRPSPGSGTWEGCRR